MARTIKRYANRKLYDVVARRYVKLEELADLIQAGEEVQVIDKESGEDITEATLSKIAAATVRQPTEPISRNALVSFIRQPSDLFLATCGGRSRPGWTRCNRLTASLSGWGRCSGTPSATA